MLNYEENVHKRKCYKNICCIHLILNVKGYVIGLLTQFSCYLLVISETLKLNNFTQYYTKEDITV